jgi:Fe-S cluster biogenesis protein NfuA
MSVSIQLEWTPNPNTIKYVVDQQLIPSGAVAFKNRESAEGRSPLAHKLLGIEGVSAVMLGANFVTVTKGEAGEWDEMNDRVMETLDRHLSAGEPVTVGDVSSGHSNQSETEIERQIRDILDAEIRPAVMNDGGDITLDRFENGIVYLHMRGSCSGCPSSLMTLKMGIEERLRDAIPEVEEVVPV